jgi:hypothetical protein
VQIKKWRSRARGLGAVGSFALVYAAVACSDKPDSPVPTSTPSPTSTPPNEGTSSALPLWSFVVPTRPTVPQVAKTDWAKNPIDLFVLQKLEASGLAPAAQEVPSRLLRRLALDLTGLPPTPEDSQAFSADPSDAAYAKLVDRYLAEAAFGEQRAHYWLDVARYADTHGYHLDDYRSIWPYRDYVIQAFASNKPFDVFTTEQLAGDLLPDATVEQRTATGFIRNAMSTDEAGIVFDEYAAVYAKDRVDTLAGAWLGLTVGCAACHNHKYDPITQKDFYALTAFFRNTTQPVRDGNRADAEPSLLVPPSEAPTLVTAEQEGTPFAFVLGRGRYDTPGEKVEAAVPASLPQLAKGEPRNRLGLAHWLTAPEQPLTARVAVNRFWAELFGAGIVRSMNDFGRIGDLPTHPELLDWLAVEFRSSGWDVKHLFRLMVTSASYRQAANVTAEKLGRDADNRLFSRGPRFRMDGEMVRDLALAASDLLVKTVGGPSVKPYQPPNVWEVVGHPVSNTAIYQQESGEALHRRSVYTFWKRQAPPPSMELFNAPSREQSVVQRERTNTPLQALVTLNDVQFIEAARVLAAHALAQESTPSARLDYLSLRVLSRPLSSAEKGVFSELVTAELANYAADPSAADALVHVGETPPPTSVVATELAAWTLVANTFLNLDEALTK